MSDESFRMIAGAIIPNSGLVKRESYNLVNSPEGNRMSFPMSIIASMVGIARA